jgi:hypothetical protein
MGNARVKSMIAAESAHLLPGYANEPRGRKEKNGACSRCR